MRFAGFDLGRHLQDNEDFSLLVRGCVCVRECEP